MEIAGAVTSRYRSNRRGSAHHRDLFYAACFCAEDHAFVVESERAGERNIRDGCSNFGATLVVEATPIEEWLELEFGVTALVTSGHPELSSDLIFKKPFRLSPTSEFMIGLGPTVARALSGPERCRPSWSDV